MFPPRPTQLAHQILTGRIPEGSLVIDATAGNGHDTLFLAERVGPNGKVIAFDIQQAAIRSAMERVDVAGLRERVEWRCESHARMAEHAAPGTVAVIMFNLGYLPGQDHQITTRTEETLSGLMAAEKLIMRNGVLSIVCYPGHDEGAMEAEAVVQWMESLADRGWRLARYGMTNTRNPAPFLLLAGRSGEPQTAER